MPNSPVYLSQQSGDLLTFAAVKSCQLAPSLSLRLCLHTRSIPCLSSSLFVPAFLNTAWICLPLELQHWPAWSHKPRQGLLLVVLKAHSIDLRLGLLLDLSCLGFNSSDLTVWVQASYIIVWIFMKQRRKTTVSQLPVYSFYPTSSSIRCLEAILNCGIALWKSFPKYQGLDLELHGDDW